MRLNLHLIITASGTIHWLMVNLLLLSASNSISISWSHTCHGSCIPMCAAVDCIPEHYKDSNMNWDHKKCSLYGVAGCPLFRGCLSIEVNGMTVGTCGIVCYTHISCMGVRCWGVSVKRGSTVLIYVGLAGSIDNIPYPRVYYLWWCTCTPQKEF